MTNSEKYKDIHELTAAFDAFCKGHPRCAGCPFRGDDGVISFAYCVIMWLKQEAKQEAEEEKLMPLSCPFCGHDTHIFSVSKTGPKVVYCNFCNYDSRAYPTEAEAIAAHNRVVRAVMEAKEGGMK